jgi:AcrR family transcriptional regulator
VVRQARGAATRQKILEAAVELFTDNGFGVTTLNDIADRAELTGGALYYHFESKEALAIGIIDEGWPKTWDLIVKHLDSAALGLESIIRMTFALTDVMQRDNLLWLAHHLGHTFGQANLEAREGCQKRMTMSSIGGLKRSGPLTSVTESPRRRSGPTSGSSRTGLRCCRGH